MRGDGEFGELIASISCDPFTFDSIGHCATVAMPCKMFGSEVSIRAQRLYRVDQPDDEVILDVLALATTLLTHEVQEHFKVNGETWRNPHTDGNAFDLRANPLPAMSAPVAVAAPPEAPPSVPVAARLATGWHAGSTSTVAYWPASDPRRQRPKPLTAQQRQQRVDTAAVLAEQLARLEALRDL
jgi:hypothetical protein